MPRRRNPETPAAPTTPAVADPPLAAPSAAAGISPEVSQALQVYLDAEKEFVQFEAMLNDGSFMAEIIATAGSDIERAKQEWQTLWAQARARIEDLNTKRRAVADALRQVVQLTPNQWRGPDGAPTKLTAGAFQVSSVTKRTFDAQSLFQLVGQHGLLERLLEVTALDRNGKPFRIVEQKWAIDYEGVLNWLRANKLEDVINGAYDEKESTPQVKGPKELCFFGDRKKD